MIKILKWAAVLAGVIAIPILLKKRYENVQRRNENIRYDINDYVSESGL